MIHPFVAMILWGRRNILITVDYHALDMQLMFPARVDWVHVMVRGCLHARSQLRLAALLFTVMF